MTVFSSDYEKELFDELKKIDPKLADIFYSGLVVLYQKKPIQTQISKSFVLKDNNNHKDTQNNIQNINPKILTEENPDRIAQSAHSMRETTNRMLKHPKITQLVSKPPEIAKTKLTKQQGKKQKKEPTQREKLQRLSDPQGGLPDYLQIVDQLVELHKYVTNVSHHGHYPSEEEYNIQIQKFIRLLLHIIRPHYTAISEIDKLIVKANPNESDLEEVEFLIRNTEAYNHFFQTVKESWADVLYRDGKYFKEIPKVIQKGNLCVFPSWPESYYLKQIASKRPALVQKIILEITPPANALDKNPRVLYDFVGAALKMPPELAKSVAEKAIEEEWHKDWSSFSILALELASLMIQLTDAEFDTSLKLCSVLLEATSYDSSISSLLGHVRKDLQSVIDKHSYDEILKNNLPVLYDKDHDAVLDVLICKLVECNHFVNGARNSDKDPNQDYSCMWRRAIEEHEQNSNYDLRSTLVRCIRDVLEKSESYGIENLRKSLRKLCKHNTYIFRRLEIYFYSRHPLEFSDEINQSATKYFAKHDILHEYYYMLKKTFPYLREKTRKELLSMISNGPSFEDYNGTWEEFETRKKYWKIEKLSPIIEYLPDLKEEYNSLVSECGKPEHADFAIYRSASYPVKQTSALTDDMTTEEVIEHIKSYTPQGMFVEEDGSGRKFQELVEKNPGEYSRYVTQLLHCHGLFHFRFLNALYESKDSTEINWDAVLTFCESVITTSHSNDSESLDLTLFYLGNLLRSRLTLEKTSIPFDLRGKVWETLSGSIKLASPDTTWSNNYPNENQDACSIFMNSNIGILVEAVIQYATWCHNELQTKNTTSTKLAPEVKSFFDSVLNAKHKHSVSIHAVLGHHFNVLVKLDKEWSKSNIHLIFNPDTKAGYAAWDAYTFQSIFVDSYDILFNEYMRKIECMSKKTKPSFVALQERFAQQIGLIYLNQLDRSNELFEKFLQKADPHSLEVFLHWIGRVLKDWDDNAPPKMSVHKLLSYEKILSNQNAGWLLLNSFMPKSDRINKLSSVLDQTEGEISPVYFIVSELLGFVREFPLQTMECIEKIVKRPINENILMIQKDLKNIFQEIATLDNEPVKEKMKQIIDFLGSLGHGNDFTDYIN